MFLVNWLYNAITSTLLSLGLKNKKAKIVFLGLDDAGKSTLMNMLKNGVMKQLQPTGHPHSQELILGNITFKAWDLGGHQAARKTWRNYTCDIDGIVYLVDSSNPKRFQQSRYELDGLREMTELQNIPILVLGNKIDKQGAVSPQQLRSQLGIQDDKISNSTQNKQKRPLELFMCSVPKKFGYPQGFKWLSKFLK